MTLVNIDTSLAKKYVNMDKTLLYCKLMPYKNNTAIKVYTKEGEPIGDIPEDEISNYLSKETEILFIKEKFNDDTGLIELVVETML